MRLLELVRCGRPVVVDESPSPSPSPSASPETPEKRRRQRRAAVSAWQPSLGAISEDGVLFIPPAKSPPSPAKAGKNPEKGRARRTAAARQGERDSYRNYDVPAVFPSFAPTIFLF